MTRRPDLLLLDLDSPGGAGVPLIQRLREWSQIPILVLTRGGQEHMSLAALEAGADEYVSKPFSPEELRGRVRLALRRGLRAPQPDPEAATLIRMGDLQIDRAARRVTVRGRAVHLTPVEYRLLGVLGHHVGQVVSCRQLLLDVWGPLRVHQQAQLLRVHMAHLRRKLEADPRHPQVLLTEPGVGYRLSGEPRGRALGLELGRPVPRTPENPPGIAREETP
jgi:two-component system KDP operon response regulator KdpE